MSALPLLVAFLQEGTTDGTSMVAVIIALIIGLIVFAIYIYSIVWVYRDANRRGKSGVLVALLVALISWPIGLLVWVLVRDKV
jgi:hypothetical protein